jgi:hypothetical protein
MTGPQTCVRTVICARPPSPPGCARTVDGAISTRRPLAEAAHRAVQIGALDGLLLTQQQILDLVGCSHAMTVGYNVVAEARVCLLGGDINDTAAAANGLLDEIVAKIPQ